MNADDRPLAPKAPQPESEQQKYFRRRNSSAYGITFTSAETADAYADALRTFGYSVDVSPAFNTAETLADAITQAQEFFKDPRLVTPTKG
jgi:uroporphyrinogen-III synthase